MRASLELNRVLIKHMQVTHLHIASHTRTEQSEIGDFTTRSRFLSLSLFFYVSISHAVESYEEMVY